ncbi:VCBS repeat-containing protein, partial [bacterium]|nr:VCBS repeat-containing protein [bacterium]
VYRSQNEGGPFTRVTDDLIEDIAYFRDKGLGLLTRYYYQVSSVDSNLVESTVSAAIAQSTAPPEITNFPLPFNGESSGHFAVGDVTGDGHLDIVFGASEIYVWQRDGSELFDGDGDSQTLGPITNVQGTFGPMGIALAELNGEPGLEIVCQDRDAMLVHVYDAKTGTDIPGWPQSVGLNWAWATPAVGDLDNDGDLEIVMNNQAGQTLAWHHDGTEVRDGDANPATNGVFAVRPEGRWAYDLSSPALFDVDGDGNLEIIFGTRYSWNAENKLHALKLDGTDATGFPYVAGLGASITSSPTTADLNGDGVWEIIFLHERHKLVVLEQDGTDYPGFPMTLTSTNGNTACPSPAVGDFDGDGQLEIACISTVSVVSAFVTVVDTDPSGGSGTVLPGWPQEIPGNSESSPVVGDINGDGFPDIVHGIGGGDEETLNEIFAFDHQGNPVEGFPITLGGPIRPALVITDLDDDHDVDIVYGGWDGAMHVWDMPFPADGTQIPWGTFRGHYHRDGVYRNYSPTGVEEAPAPVDLTLGSIRPNPFNPSTTVRLYVPAMGREGLEVDVFDVQGRRVRRLHEGALEAGWHDFVWNGRDDAGKSQASGLYLLRAKGGDTSVSAKMALIR